MCVHFVIKCICVFHEDKINHSFSGWPHQSTWNNTLLSFCLYRNCLSRSVVYWKHPFSLQVANLMFVSFLIELTIQKNIFLLQHCKLLYVSSALLPLARLGPSKYHFWTIMAASNGFIALLVFSMGIATIYWFVLNG